MLPQAQEIVSASDKKMKDAIAFLEEDLKSYRSGRANPTILNNVCVDYYGTETPISQVASVTTPDAKTIAIQPWEKSLIKEIEKAITDANLGLTPSNNGETIRCMVPALTEERRKDLIKKVKAAGENAKIVVRNVRRDGVDSMKKAQKASELSEDAAREGEDEMQKITDKAVKEIDNLVSEKEQEILTV